MAIALEGASGGGKSTLASLLVGLDERFAALDPETLHQALRCVLHRASTLLVIAHP